MGRAVYGRIYELALRDPEPDEAHPYVGLTREVTIHQRVHGSGGHTSPEDVAKDPWKARILPGRAGYRQLEVVYCTDDPAEDERTLRRAEAYWIDKLQTKYNTVRPVRPFGEPSWRGAARKPAARAPQRRPAPRTPTYAQAKRERAQSRRVTGLLLLVALFTAVAAVLINTMALPWPAATWIGAPVAGWIAAWPVFLKLRSAARKVLR